MTKTILIHHDADYDGLLSKEVFLHFHPGAETIGWDYGRSVPERDWTQYDQIYMIDISIPELMKLKNLIWIDHHKSAIEKWIGQEIASYCIDGVAACRLAWQWFHGNVPAKEEYVHRKVAEPPLIRLAGEYDIWDLRDPHALDLQSGLRQLDEKEFTIIIRDQFTQGTHSSLLQHCLDIGARARKAKEKADAGIVTKFSHDIKLEGLTFLCCNTAHCNSQFFTAAIKPHHDALMGWRYDGVVGKCTVSLYHAPGREHHDLSQIAVARGGGGHKGACGFQCSLSEMVAILCVPSVPSVP